MSMPSLRDESGAPLVERALVIATVSILLVVALEPLAADAGLGGLIDFVFDCLGGAACS